MRNRSQKTAETLLLEPTKNKEKKVAKGCLKQGTAQRKTWKPASHQAKLKKKVFGTRMRKGRTPAGCVPKPLRNRSRKTAETLLLEPTKNAETLLLEPTKNKEKRLPQARQTFAQRKTWKPASHQAKLKKNVFGTRMRNVRLGSLQATRPNSRKRCLGRACEKAEPQQVCAQAIAKPQPEKCRNVAFGTH